MTESIDRHLAVLPQGEEKTYLSWRLLPTDAKDEEFRVERGQNGHWESVTPSPVTTSTDFGDRTPSPGVYDYRVMMTAGSLNGAEQPLSLVVLDESLWTRPPVRNTDR